jgi:hypothetical protein
MHADAFLMYGWHVADPLLLELVVDIIRNGVNMSFLGNRGSRPVPPNLPSFAPHRAAIILKIEEAISKGEMHGWFKSPPFWNLFVHRCGVVPKGDEGKWRLIEHFSDPAGSSVNDFTPKVKLNFCTVADAIRRFHRAGLGCFMVVFDKKSAYPSLAVRAEDHHLNGLHVPGKGYAYSVVSKFGARASGTRWERVAGVSETIIEDRLQEQPAAGPAELARWVDDFIGFLSRCSTQAAVAVDVIVTTTSELGFALKPSKCSDISNVAVWAGIGFRSWPPPMMVFLPHDKLRKMRKTLSRLASASSWSLFDIRSAVGSLLRIAMLYKQCRGFLGRFLRLKAAIEKQNGPGVVSSARARSITITPPRWVPLDIQTWDAIICAWDGSRLLHVCAALGDDVEPDLHFRIDAAAVFGQGIWCCSTGDWISAVFSKAQLEFGHGPRAYSTPLLELLPVVSLLLSFDVRGKVLHIDCDCEAAVKALRKGYTAKSEKMDHVLRAIAALCCLFNCLVIPHDIYAQDNQEADMLSRGNVAEFLALMKGAAPSANPSPIPLASWPGRLSSMPLSHLW